MTTVESHDRAVDNVFHDIRGNRSEGYRLAICWLVSFSFFKDGNDMRVSPVLWNSAMVVGILVHGHGVEPMTFCLNKLI